MKYEIWFACTEEKMHRCRFMAGYLRMTDEVPADTLPAPEHAVVITGDPDTLQRFGKKGYCCIGFDPSGETFFEGAEYVITELKSVSEDLIVRAYDHHFRRPHTIAETERLLIRESTEEDYPVVSALIRENGDAAIWFFTQGNTISKEEYLSYIGMTYRFFEFGNWSVCEKSTGEVIGWCGLNPVRVSDPGMAVLRYHSEGSPEGEETSPDDDTELGYVIRRDRRGRGCAYEACAAILRYAEHELGITKYCVHIRAGNESSFRLARKLGFTG